MPASAGHVAGRARPGSGGIIEGCGGDRFDYSWQSGPITGSAASVAATARFNHPRFLTQAPRLTLVLQQKTRLGLPVLVVYDNSGQPSAALQVAARLVQENAGQLTVIMLADTAEAAQQAEHQVAAWLQAHELTARYHWLASATLARLRSIVAMERGRLLILPGANAALRGDALLALLDELHTSVLVVQ